MEFDEIELVDLEGHDDHPTRPSITLRLNTVPPPKWEEFIRKRIRGRRSTGPGGTIKLTDIDLGASFSVTVHGTRLQIQGIDLEEFKKFGLKSTLKAAVSEANEACRARRIQDIRIEDRRRQSEKEVKQQRRDALRRAWEGDD